MVIKKEKEAGLNFSDFNMQRVIKERCGQIDATNISEEFKKDSKDRIINTVNNEGSKFYLPSKTVIDLSSRIKVDINDFDYKFLDTISEKKITFLLGDMFYRWTKTEGKINVLAANQMEIPLKYKHIYPIGTTHDIAYVFFSFDTKRGALSFPANVVSPFSEETVLTFLRLLIFTELTPIETRTLFPNQSTGTRRAGKYTNSSKSNVILVDSNWNTKIIITQAFLVSGHFRLQKYGVNNSKIKPIWINAFGKDGYTRGANKTNNE